MKEKKRGFSRSNAKSSAVIISIAIHVALLVVALFFVAVRVIVRDDQTFDQVKVNRPRMKLQKLVVPVTVKKQKPKPKLRKTIVVKRPVKTVDLKLPEMVGVKGGTGYLDGDGGLGGLGFGLELGGVFGRDKGTGNELEGTFFDLKMDPDRRPHKMNDDAYKDALRGFIGSWNPRRLEKKYFKAPKKKFATTFIVPKMNATAAPKAYKVDKVVKPKYWAAYYNGMIAAPETGKYRFWGAADDLLIVQVKGRMVLDGTRKGTVITNWKSDDPRNKKFKVSGEEIKIGDWFKLSKGEAVEMEVLIGERPGGLFNCTLLIEQQGVNYKKGKGGRPILPIFKTAEIPKEIVGKMKIDRGACTTKGPTFGVMK